MTAKLPLANANTLVIGLDLSLTGTGWATFNGKVTFGTLSPPKNKRTGMGRISWMLSRIFRVIEQHGTPKLVTMEGLAFASRDRNLERAGLAFLVRYKLWKRGVPYVLVAPTSLKKFTSGSGKAEKSGMMLQVFKRWQIEPANDNEADAISLVQVARQLEGLSTPETKAQQQVLNTIRKNLAKET